MMLIPIYGLYGAALATAIAMIVEAAMLHSVAFRRLWPKRSIFVASSPAKGERQP